MYNDSIDNAVNEKQLNLFFITFESVCLFRPTLLPLNVNQYKNPLGQLFLLLLLRARKD